MLGRLVVGLLPVACLAYAAVALGVGPVGPAWLSAAAALILGWLLWRRHPRARFAAYIFFSALALRAVTSSRWLTLALAVGGVLLLQAPSARDAWPRLRPGWSRQAGDRMRRS